MTLFGYNIELPVNSRYFSFPQVHFGDDDDIYISFTENDELKVYRSSNKGESWKDISPSSSVEVDDYNLIVNDNDEISILFQPEEGSIGSSKVNYMKRNIHDKWSKPVTIASDCNNYFVHTFINDTTLLMGYVREDKTAIQFLISNNSGATWQDYSYSPYAFPKKMIYYKDSTIYLSIWDTVTSDDQLLISTDLGKTWNLQNSKLPGEAEHLIINPDDENLYIIYIVNSEFKIEYSEDDGESWDDWEKNHLLKDRTNKDHLSQDVCLAFSSTGKGIIVYEWSYSTIPLPWSSFGGISYFWIEKDNLIDNYIIWYFLLMILATLIGSAPLIPSYLLFRRHEKKKLNEIKPQIDYSPQNLN